MKKQVTLVRQEVFDSLPEYSCSFPTALPVGKQWKCRRDGQWWLARVTRHIGSGKSRLAQLKWTELHILKEAGAR